MKRKKDEHLHRENGIKRGLDAQRDLMERQHQAWMNKKRAELAAEKDKMLRERTEIARKNWQKADILARDQLRAKRDAAKPRFERQQTFVKGAAEVYENPPRSPRG